MTKSGCTVRHIRVLALRLENVCKLRNRDIGPFLFEELFLLEQSVLAHLRNTTLQFDNLPDSLQIGVRATEQFRKMQSRLEPRINNLLQKYFPIC